MAGIFLVYVVAAIGIYFWQGSRKQDNSQFYKVEIHEIMAGLEKDGKFSEPDLRGREYVREVAFLPVPAAGSENRKEDGEEKWKEDWQKDWKKEVKDFYHARNGKSSFVQPLFAGEELAGYVRFDYETEENSDWILWMAEGIWLCSGIFLFTVLLYIGNRIVKPFHVLSDMPYELSKGHLQGELEESRSRFFGKFVWGISMLQDTLSESRAKELKLEKEKKMLLLSLSHDIKIPLSTIKLYAKAWKEGVYHTEEEKIHAIGQIEKHALEIEEFIKEIIAASSEDIFMMEVEDGEFYLGDYVEKVRKYYEPKCRLVMAELEIGSYDNKLLKGDMDRALEVMENLMENAFKYGDGRKISIGFYEEDYCQVIRVFNTGTAVEPEEMPHLFDSFYRGSNVEGKEGNGLGLYIGRQMMRKMDGDLFAERAEEGMGVCMVFALRGS